MSNDNINLFERLFKLWAVIAKLVMDGKRDIGAVADHLQLIVDGTVAVVQKFIVSRGKLLVNYGQSVGDLLKAGKYGWINDSINDTNFPSSETGERELDTAMFHFDRNMFSEAVEAEMDKVGYRPATMKELLAYGIKNPNEQRQYPIVGLGSVAVLSGDRRVGCLCGNVSGRRAGLGCYGDVWIACCRFLGVRKNSVS